MSPEEETARAAADPLVDLRALMTDNTIAVRAGEDENDTSFGFQLQPVYSVPYKTRFNMTARAVVPIVGVESGVLAPSIRGEPRPEDALKRLN